MKMHRGEHVIIFDTVELVGLESGEVFLVDRKREELRRIDDSNHVLKLVQTQYGSLPDGGDEILERYESADGTDSMVLDSSPDWLKTIRID